MRLAVVSWPANSSRMAVPMISSVESASRSSRASTSWLIMSAVGAAVRASTRVRK